MLGKAGNISIPIPGPEQPLWSAYGGMWWNGSWASASAVLLPTCGRILDAFVACCTPWWGLGQNHDCSHWELWACFPPAFCFGSCFWPFYAEHTYLVSCCLCFSSASWDLTVHKYQWWSMRNLQEREAWSQTCPCCSSRGGQGLAEHSVPSLTSLVARLYGHLPARQ